MTNNDDMALKLKLAAEKLYSACMTKHPNRIKYSWITNFRSHASPVNILSLLAERTADKAENASLRQRVAELETICAESYQVVGALADAIGVFNTLPTIKALDNLSGAVLHHKDVLPFSVEARTVSVKLPGQGLVESTTVQSIRDYADGWNAYRDEAIKVLTAAGIKLEVGE